jgi:molybdopterin-guanine dinucleotide biosynthesis protein
MLVPGTRPIVIGVGGFVSNVGKTTLVCELLKRFPGWEAIKTTRGHYRSCGKDPQACCVSHLLTETAIVRSGYEETYAPDKDTGRYWDVGAANVHWVIATEDQVGAGIREALTRVRSAGVIVEGNSFSEFVDVDLMFMVARAAKNALKKSGRRTLSRTAAVYLTGETTLDATAIELAQFKMWLQSSGMAATSALPVYTASDFGRLVTQICQIAQPALIP